MKNLSIIQSLVCVALLTVSRIGVGQTLTFEGLQDGEAVYNYYNGGYGTGTSMYPPSGPGPNYGVTFTFDALALIEQAAGGTGRFTNEPSPVTTVFFKTGSSQTMNVAAGFTGNLSFYYASRFTGNVSIWSDLNGTGTLLATFDLMPSPNIDPMIYNIWEQVGISFNGLAKSVNFSGTANHIGFDDITIGTVNANVTGTIELEGVDDLTAISPGAPPGTFHISFRTPGTTTEQIGYDVSIVPVGAGSPLGSYSLIVPPGTYDVSIQGNKSLSVTTPNVTVSTMTFAIPDVMLPAGDVNGDNVVDTQDFNALIGVFGNIYDPDVDNSITGYDPTADLNYDGRIDVSDFNLLAGEYGNVGG